MNLTVTKPFPILETDRLILRNIDEKDAPEVLDIRSQSANLKYTDRAPAKDLNDALAHINTLVTELEKQNWINWTMTLKGVNKAIGFIGFWHYHETLPQAEIGYELHPDYHGKGYMSEAMQAVLNFGTNEMKIETVLAELHDENEKSLNLLKRFGFVHDEHFKIADEPRIVLWKLNVNANV